MCTHTHCSKFRGVTRALPVPGSACTINRFKIPNEEGGKKPKNGTHTHGPFLPVSRGVRITHAGTHTHAEGEILRSFESEGFGSEAGTRAPTGRDRLFLLMSYFLFPTLHPVHRIPSAGDDAVCVCVCLSFAFAPVFIFFPSTRLSFISGCLGDRGREPPPSDPCGQSFDKPSTTGQQAAATQQAAHTISWHETVSVCVW